jgi:hypothetical protein
LALFDRLIPSSFQSRVDRAALRNIVLNQRLASAFTSPQGAKSAGVDARPRNPHEINSH